MGKQDNRCGLYSFIPREVSAMDKRGGISRIRFVAPDREDGEVEI